MAYRPMKYQYETSPRKLKPEYEPKKNTDIKKKSSTLKQKNKKSQKQAKLEEIKSEISEIKAENRNILKADEEYEIGNYSNKKNGSIIYDYVNLNTSIISLKEALKNYYKNYIQDKLFKYELLK